MGARLLGVPSLPSLFFFRGKVPKSVGALSCSREDCALRGRVEEGAGIGRRTERATR